MQTLVAGPRAGLSVNAVTGAYQADALTVGMGAELVRADASGVYQVLADLTADLAGGTVERDNLATVHGTCKLALSRDLAWGADRVRPFMTLSGIGPAGYVPPVRWNLGVYLLTTPSLTPGMSLRTNAATGFDTLWFLNQVIGDSYSLPAGTVVLDAVRALITAAPGAGTRVLLDGTASAKTLASDMTWVLDDSHQPTHLQVVNDLLGVISYRSLWADEDGAYRSEPYVDPRARGTEWAHTVVDPRTSLVSTERTQTMDLFDVPNQWRFIQKGLTAKPVATDGSDGLYVVTNQADGITSVAARGFLKRKVVFVDAADAASLRALGDQQVAVDRLDTRTLAVKTAPMPGAGHFDVYSYLDADLGGQLKVQTQKWSLDLEGADMTQTWQVVA